MKTQLSDAVQKALRGATDALAERADGLDTSWSRRKKPMSYSDHLDMCRFLRTADVDEIGIIGRGIHRPWQITFKEGYKVGKVNCQSAVYKTIRSISETRYYNRSTDKSVTSPEREIAAYMLDRSLGFNLVPPTIGRDILGMGFGSVQAWVDAPLAADVQETGYSYKKDFDNPWLHILCAFDFMIGNMDRHGANIALDTFHRVYAIDNGYSFVRDDIRNHFRSTVGKRLYGFPIHPIVKDMLNTIDTSFIVDALQPFRFRSGEIDGVVARFGELKTKTVWNITDGLWGETE